MKKGNVKILIFLTILTPLILISCESSESFIVSGYTAGTGYDVALYSIGDDNMVNQIAGFRCGENPSYFTEGDNGLYYFVNEVDTFNLKVGGGITTLRIDPVSNAIEKVGSMNQGGGGPCHITLAAEKRHLITANYGSGSVSVVRLNRSGIPAMTTDVIWYGEKSRPHMTQYNPRLRQYYITDLGLDRIHILRLDTTAGILLNADKPYIVLPEGSGPRHMVIDGKAANLYVANERNSTVTVFDILPETPVMKQTVSTLPEGYQETNYCADIHLSDNGRYLCISNRGHNSITTFRISSDGTLSQPVFTACGGNWPRNFAVSRSGRLFVVANQRSNEISVLPAVGEVSEENSSRLPFIAPACVQFLN